MNNTLCKLHGAKREVGFTETSPGVWEKSIPLSIITKVEVNGVEVEFSFTETTLTIETEDNPNNEYCVVTRSFQFAKMPDSKPYNLDDGFEVYFEPCLLGVSSFGTELDLENFGTIAVDSSTSLSFIKNEWWLNNFDAYVFENQKVFLYDETSTLVFQGKIESKVFGESTIQVKCRDNMADLRGSLSLPLASTLENTQLSKSDDSKLVRNIYGHVKSFIPLNFDSLREGYYPFPGYVEVTFNDATALLTESAYTYLSIGDSILIDETEMTIASITNANTIEFTEVWPNPNVTTNEAFLKPESPKRWMNRVWKIANHTLREPETTTLAGSTTNFIFVDSTRDMFDGDIIEIGSTNVVINKVLNENSFTLSTSLQYAPMAGTSVKRFSVQNVKIDGELLQPTRDYVIDADTATLTLNNEAEWNAGKTYESAEAATFTSGSRTVTGSGTSFKSWVSPGMLLRAKGQTVFFEVLSVESDTSLTLRTTSTYSSTANIQFKELIFWKESVLTVDVLGKTIDGTAEGLLLKTPHLIIQDLLFDAGVSIDEIGEFEESSKELAFAVPQSWNSTKIPTFRDVINQINQSVFGILFQTNEFKFGFKLLKPRVPSNRHRFSETDLLSMSYQQSASKMQGTIQVAYAKREWDFSLNSETESLVTASSQQAQYILKTLKAQKIETLLENEREAYILAKRTSFLFDRNQSFIVLDVKSTSSISVGDTLEIDNPRMPPKFGTNKTLCIVQSVKKDLRGFIRIEAIDLSGSFLSACFIGDAVSDYASSDSETRLTQGYFKDGHLIDSDESTLSRYLIF